MVHARRFLVPVVLAGILAGCDGGSTPANVLEEQKATDYGQKSMDKMKEMYGTPSKGGQLKK